MDNAEDIKSECKNAFYDNQKVLSIPIHPWMKFNKVGYIVLVTLGLHK